MAGENREPDADLTPGRGAGDAAGGSGGEARPGDAAGRGDAATAPGFPPELVALFARMEAEPWRFHPYTAMRKLEAAMPDRPRFGQSIRLKDDPLRFGQEPTLAFAPASLASFRWRGARAPRLDTFFLGVFGPNGPLPLHLTEYARQRERNCAAAGAEVEYSQVGAAPYARERLLDEEFGLRAGHERVRRDHQGQRPELPHPGDVGERHPGSAPLHRVLEAAPCVRVERILRVRHQVGARHVDRAGQQQLGVQPRAVAAPAQPIRRPGESVPYRFVLIQCEVTFAYHGRRFLL